MKNGLNTLLLFLLACTISSFAGGTIAAILVMISQAYISGENILIAAGSSFTLLIFWPVILIWSLLLAKPIAILGGLLLLLLRKLGVPDRLVLSFALIFGSVCGFLVGITLSGGREVSLVKTWPNGLAVAIAGGFAGYIFWWTWRGGLQRALN